MFLRGRIKDVFKDLRMRQMTGLCLVKFPLLHIVSIQFVTIPVALGFQGICTFQNGLLRIVYMISAKETHFL